MVKAKPNQKFHVDKLASTLDKLDQLESKPKEELTLRESIYFLRGKLNSALKKGYSYKDLSEILAEQDILVSAATLKLYLTESSKSKKSKSRIKKSKSASSSKSRDKSSNKLSTNVTDSKEDLASGNSDAEINSMKDSTDSEPAVNVNSTTGTPSSTANSKKAKAKPKRQSSSNKSNTTKTNVLSGRSDDLSSEFNDF